MDSVQNYLTQMQNAVAELDSLSVGSHGVRKQVFVVGGRLRINCTHLRRMDLSSAEVKRITNIAEAYFQLSQLLKR